MDLTESNNHHLSPMLEKSAKEQKKLFFQETSMLIYYNMNSIRPYVLTLPFFKGLLASCLFLKSLVLRRSWLECLTFMNFPSHTCYKLDLKIVANSNIIRCLCCS